MLSLDHLPGRTLHLNGAEWLHFSGTSYLGIAHDPVFRDWLREGMDRYGVHFGGSRLSNMHLDVFSEMERYLESYTGAEKALVVSSGSLAGQLTLKQLHGVGELHLAPGVHPALWNDQRPPALSWEQWVELVMERGARPGPPLVLMANSIDPLYARRYAFHWLNDWHPRREVVLVIDDSHGFGITGRDGAGIFTDLHISAGVELLVVSSLGKGIGIPAGAILGPKRWLDAIWHSPHFGGASPPPPAYLYAFMHARERYRDLRAHLHDNIDHFSRRIPSNELFRSFPGFPVFYTPRNELAEWLAQDRIWISSFPYPTPEDPLITRLVLSSCHTRNDLDALVGGIEGFLKG